MQLNGGELSADYVRQSENDGGLLRMSLLEHLEELRARMIKALWGFGVVFILCATFSNQLFDVVLAPGLIALKNTGIAGAEFIAIDVTEQFSIVWLWTPVVASLFLSAPWIFWQVWSFISPGLYERERKWAIPFVVSTAGLFIVGGLFAYFIAFPFGMTFLFGLSRPSPVVPKITIDNYFAKFVDVMLGVGLVFELPILIFFLTLIRVASPAFLLKHSRYAILAISLLAAIATPTADAVNLMLFAVPMYLLFFVGVFASYLLVLKREGRRFPWRPFSKWMMAVVIVLTLCVAAATFGFGYHLTRHWPFLAR